MEARPVPLLCRVVSVAAAVEKGRQGSHGKCGAKGDDEFLFHRMSPPIFIK